jgi:hypothetical protein
MKTIWKFPLGYQDDPRFEIEVPAGANPLRVDFDPQGVLVMWASVDPDAEPVTAAVTVVGTGSPIPQDAGEYVSTFFAEPFVFHAFVEVP